MLELPDTMKAGLGLQARSFRQRESAPQDVSGWTDTPGDKERRERVSEEREQRQFVFKTMNL